MERLMPENFCIIPFIHTSIKSNGIMKLCCRSTQKNMINNSVLSLNNYTIKQAWNTILYKDIRKQMLNNEQPIGCMRCYNEEKNGITSKRQSENKLWSKRINFKSFTKDISGGYSPDIKYLDIQLGNKCNLACIMCNPSDSSLMNKHYIEANKYSNKFKMREDKNGLYWWQHNHSFWEEIYKYLNSIESLYIIGGEPTIIPEFKMLLKKCIDTNNAKHIRLRFTTNGTHVSDELLSLYKKFKEVQIDISVDGMEKYHEYIRYPGNWKILYENLKIYNNLSEAKHINVNIGTTVTLLNVEHLPDFLMWLLTSKLNNIISNKICDLHLLYNPDFLNITCLTSESKERINKKYETFYDWLEKEKYHINLTKLKNIISYMNSINNVDKLTNTVEYLNIMDKVRKNRLDINM